MLVTSLFTSPPSSNGDFGQNRTDFRTLAYWSNKATDSAALLMNPQYPTGESPRQNGCGTIKMPVGSKASKDRAKAEMLQTLNRSGFGDVTI